MRKMLKFIIPIWISMVINSMLGIIDYSFVADISTNYISVIGIAYVPFSLITSLIVGIGIETNRATAKREKINFTQILIMSLMIAVVITVIARINSKHLLFFAKDNILYNEILSYFNIIILLLIPNSIFYVCTGILRGNGVPEKSIKFNISTLVLNLIFDYLFIKMNILGNPLKGCAVASVLAESLVALIYIYIIYISEYIDKSKMQIIKFVKNTLTYSTEKLFSASTLQLITTIYISQLTISESSIYFAIDEYFAPIMLLAYCHFEWILFANSKKIKYNSKQTNLYYAIITVIYNLGIIYYLGLGREGKVYSFIYIIYCVMFFIERTLVAATFSKERGGLVNKVVLCKSIILIILLQIALSLGKFNLVLLGLINCCLIFIESLYIFLYDRYKIEGLNKKYSQCIGRSEE